MRKATRNLVQVRRINRLILPLLACLAACGIVTKATLTPTPMVIFYENDDICTDGPAVAHAWEDLNGDGMQDSNEPPMEGVCVMATYIQLPNDPNFTPNVFSADCSQDSYEGYTRKDGTWTSMSLFVGGCGTRHDVATQEAEQCQNIIYKALPPDGYQFTTATEVIGCEASFGFIRKP